MGQQCSGPFTSLAVLDENTLLVVGRRKSGNSRSEVMFLLQPVASEWRCWPLLTEGFEKEGVVLRSFRSVWNASGEESHSGVVRNSCWIWGLCSTATGWQDRRWKLTWNVSVRPIEVQVARPRSAQAERPAGPSESLDPGSGPKPPEAIFRQCLGGENLG